MAGSQSYTAILDACVLYPAPLRDLLMSLAVEGLFHARWTHDIHDEWINNLHENRPDLDLNTLKSTKELMIQAVPDSLITNHAKIIDSLILPDPNDRHVLAAAITGHADAIVTFNLKDFPAEAIKEYNVEILHPDDFVLLQYGLNKVRVLTAVKELRARLTRPVQSAEQLLRTYEAQGLPQTCQVLTHAITLI